MSAGHVHTRASIMLAGGFLLGVIVTRHPIDLWYSVGALIGVMISPDTDVDSGFSADKYIRQRTGVAGEYVWGSVWNLYRKSLKHGSSLSHFPVISTLGRIMYLYFLFIFLPYLIMSFFIHFDIRFWLYWWSDRIFENWRIVIGLICADTIHWALDLLTTEHSTKRKPPR